MVILSNFSKQDFVNILSNYGIGKYKNHKHVESALGNTVFILKTSKNKYVLKIFETTKLSNIKFQTKVMNLLEKNNIPSPKIIKTITKEDIFKYKNKNLIIQEFIDGILVKRYSDKLLKEVTFYQAKVIKLLMKFPLGRKFIWGKDYQFRPLRWKINKFKNFDIKKENQILINELKKIKKDKLKKSYVHGDFHRVNLLIKNDRLKAILDWDDIHQDYIAQELAIFINFFISDSGRVNKHKINLYLDEFEKIIKLNSEEKKSILLFIRFRVLNSLTWAIYQLKKHKDLESKIMPGINAQIKKYRHLKRLSNDDLFYKNYKKR